MESSAEVQATLQVGERAIHGCYGPGVVTAVIPPRSFEGLNGRTEWTRWSYHFRVDNDAPGSLIVRAGTEIAACEEDLRRE